MAHVHLFVYHPIYGSHLNSCSCVVGLDSHALDSEIQLVCFGPMYLLNSLPILLSQSSVVDSNQGKTQ